MGNTNHIGFNKPYLTGKEVEYIREAVSKRKLSGNGYFTQECQRFFEERYGFKKCLLTTSCTHALEMAAILIDIQPGDEVIMPSYTFVSTANAFVLRGAEIVFVDSRSDHPGMDESRIEALITPKTKAIVTVHYAGVSCDMDKIVELADRYKLFVVEDAAQAIESYYKGKPLGGIGHLAAFSFHETKNIISGEGGMLVVNDERFIRRAEIIWEKGTNRSAFFKGEVNKYSWMDIGSSFLPSEIIAAFLYAQLEKIAEIQAERKGIWERYYSGLSVLGQRNVVDLPIIPEYASNNAHMFYMVCKGEEQRDGLITHLADQGINAVFHYLSLHRSPFYMKHHLNNELPCSDHYERNLVRLPFFYELTADDQQKVINRILLFYSQKISLT